MSPRNDVDRRSAIRAVGVGAAALGLAACAPSPHRPAMTSSAPAGPPGSQTLYLIRHAEKPTGDGAPYGVDDQGRPDKHSLTAQGWARAHALVGLFTSGQRGIATPQHLFAARPDGSRRPPETITPLAQRLGLPIDATISADDAAAAAAAAAATPGIALMAWEHHAIPAIAAALGSVDPPPPAKWPGDRFDVVWVFTRAGAGWQFSQAPQLLLDGDRPSGI
ncbi:twin-arginine translocation signal domain-containing protein [Mycobacterium sp. CBMA293]|uniref:twin-arginine translocation signal domain-containing protein n=1 Tax=unclassified Mycolicibacterium TaxID=2636767 RepID=UPI0012DD7753|nr:MULTISPECIES: twin-arginine translocation signal domain-containing protein [unclassified Mycolicibacterium]MUL48623.1 twin-arginine translocation signal domain-containing protein [Mycolicibacterium sp. CBMA 360]MUL60879.1 twin-arginine translocation signal domain-containing protein [Mycolicibacterium sp. CBMA 335]MUL71892.1 twin-arginine translocation signal domain-containing protein [Mycolicibacterium sp. CBMA 311]MUL95820.1 twin-arginine translocation signal domain-containing protein [Myco